MIEMACNVVLPENGPAWVALRSGDMSDVPSLTSSAATTLALPPSSPSRAVVDPSSATSFSSDADAGVPDFGVPDYPARDQPPAFMASEQHACSLDNLVAVMISPDPAARPTAQAILEWEAVRWVAVRRRMAATIFEGRWGPMSPLEVISECLTAEDTEMMDI